MLGTVGGAQHKRRKTFANAASSDRLKCKTSRSPAVAFKFRHPADDDFDNSAVASAARIFRPPRPTGGLRTMYQAHFGLRQRPFPATPDPARYYPATSHERAIARLLHGLTDGEGVAVLTARTGTGKTLLCHCLLERLGSDVNLVFLTNSHFGDRAGLLQAILYDLSLPYQDRGEQEMRLTLTDHLLRSYQEGQSTILILDEAQHLTPDLLEELRLLGNLEARSGKARASGAGRSTRLAGDAASSRVGRPGSASGRSRRVAAAGAARGGRLSPASCARGGRQARTAVRRRGPGTAVPPDARRAAAAQPGGPSGART